MAKKVGKDNPRTEDNMMMAGIERKGEGKLD